MSYETAFLNTNLPKREEVDEKAEFIKLFAYICAQGASRENFDERAFYIPTFRALFCDDSGHFNWDGFYDHFEFFFKEFFGSKYEDNL